MSGYWLESLHVDHPKLTLFICSFFSDIMSRKVVCFKSVEKVNSIKTLLKYVDTFCYTLAVSL